MKNIITYFDKWFVHGSISGMITIALFIITAIILNRILNSFINKRWKENNAIPNRVKRIVLWLFILYGILTQITPLQSIAATLLASGGILAVIVGLASQEAAGSMINGMMIYFGKPFKVGDFINVKELDIRGNVIDIALRHTVIETLEKTQVIIPNTTMNKAVIENISNIVNQKANYLLIDIAYESDIEKAMQIIQEEVVKHPFFIDGRSEEDKKEKALVPIHCIDFKESGIALRVTIFSKDNAHGFEMLSDLRIQIKKRFDEANIEIPYPHRTIVYKNENL